MRKILLAAALACTALWAGSAAAQAGFPDKQVKVVVPFPPGGSYDLIARDLAAKLAEIWKQPVVIDNRGGAGGNIGAQAVIAAPADGYTLLFWGDGVLSNPLLYPKPPFDASRDLAGVALAATAPQVLVSRPGGGINTVKDIVGADHVLNYGVAGSGSPGHIAAELMKPAGAKLQHINYKGGGPALIDLIGGQIDLVSTGLPACIGFIQSGKVKAVAVTSKARIRILPDVPSISETIPNYDVDSWYGFMAPKGTPDTVRNKIAADLRQVLADPALQKKLTGNGFVPMPSTPAELDAKMKADLGLWREMVAKSGAKVE
ncbi:MAG: tripartite tricarboxylate transporter substrate binding protein [Pseudomonadota bacterium]